MAGRSYQTEAVVLRSFRLGEADRVLHLYTLAHGRVGAVAKGVRKTKSRFGARLEPLSHVEIALHRGSGDLQTVTGVELLRSHHEAREDYARLSIGLIGALGLASAGIAGIEALLRRPLAEAGSAGVTERTARDALMVITSSYEYHGGFRLRTLSA